MKESTRAGPAPYRTTTPFGSTSPAAAVPIDEKMPAPMTAPMASMIRSPAPMTRFKDLSLSASSSVIGLRANSWLMSSVESWRKQAVDVDVQAVGGVLRAQDQAAARIEGEADQIAAGDDLLR